MIDPFKDHGAAKPTRCENRVLAEHGPLGCRYRAKCDHCGWSAEKARKHHFVARQDGRRHAEAAE